MKNFKTTFHCASFYFFVISLLEAKGYDVSNVGRIFGAAATRSMGIASFNTLYVDVVNKVASSVRGYGSRVRRELDKKINPISIDVVKTETDIDGSYRIIEHSFEGFTKKHYAFGWLEDKRRLDWRCRPTGAPYKEFNHIGTAESFEEAKAEIESRMKKSA